MSTKNYDASQYTKKQQAKTLGTYARALQTQIDSPTGQFVVRSTQPTYQSAVIVTYQNIGKCFCNVASQQYDNSTADYLVKGACGCGTQAGSS
jgi:hypothetical protein